MSDRYWADLFISFFFFPIRDVGYKSLFEKTPSLAAAAAAPINGVPRYRISQNP